MGDIIVDCDPGHDDAIALLLALASPEVTLLGVTTVAGNQTVQRTTANAIRVLDHAGRADIPVAAGAERPLTRELRVAAEVHGASGLDGPVLPPPSRGPSPLHAIDWIAETVRANPRPVTLVATGPLTNVALFLARHPELAGALDRIVLMGGACGQGNVTPAAEFNIWVDPEAASRVFQSSCELTMVGLDVTHQALMTPAHAARLARGGRPARLVAALFEFFVRYHQREYGWDGAPVHDALALAYVIDGTLLSTLHRAVLVDTGAEPSRGRTHVDLRDGSAWKPNCDVAVAVDAERFLEMLVSRLLTLG